MAIVVIPDLKDPTATLTEEGWQLQRIFQVSGLEGHTKPMQVVKAAKAGGVPRLGSAYPGVSTAKLTSISPTTNGLGMARLVLTYTDKPAEQNMEAWTFGGEAEISFGLGLQSVQTNTDHDGNLMTVVFVDADGGRHPQSTPISVEIPVSSVNVRRDEAVNPGPKAWQFGGTVNTQGGFNLAEPNAPARTWRCDYITGRSIDGGRSYQVEYNFTRFSRLLSPVGFDGDDTYSAWDTLAIYTDPRTGRPPEAVIDNLEAQPEAVRVFEQFAEQDFNQLGLGG